MLALSRFASLRLRAAFALVVSVGLLGCGPFGYLRKVSGDADRALAEAEAADAPQYAPYEYWGAVTYLEQAKTLMAYSEYERSFDYGVRARQLAEEAKRKAERREAGKTVETLQATPSAASDASGGSEPSQADATEAGNEPGGADSAKTAGPAPGEAGR